MDGGKAGGYATEFIDVKPLERPTIHRAAPPGVSKRNCSRGGSLRLTTIRRLARSVPAGLPDGSTVTLSVDDVIAGGSMGWCT